MKTKPKNRFRKCVSLLSAMLLAGVSSFAVYASVVYDSSKDPVVAESLLIKYVKEQLDPILSSISDMESRLEVVELTGGGGGSGSGSGGVNLDSDAAKKLLERISSLESDVSALKQSNEALENQLTSTKDTLTALITDLQNQYNTLQTEVSGLSSEIVSLQSSIATVKSDISTLNTNFKQISAISTKLETVTYKVNTLTGAGGDIAKLREEVESVTALYDGLLEKVGQLYDIVEVPYGATVYADDPDDTLMVVLRSGSARVVSPYTTGVTRQGLNDLSDGAELYDGDELPLFHNVLIPRGGDDGRGIIVTSIGGAYIMIGGDYRIVGP